MTRFALMALGMVMVVLSHVLNEKFSGYVKPRNLVELERGEQWIPALLLMYLGGLIALAGGVCWLTVDSFVNLLQLLMAA
jgi:hypothetical protein